MITPKLLKTALAPVDLFGIRFPRFTSDEAISFLLDHIQDGQSCRVCFPDMSTLNLCEQDPRLKTLINERFVPFNDGAGLQIASCLRGKPFPSNLNDTDLTPMLLQALPKDTKIYLLGATQEVVSTTQKKWQKEYPALQFVGAHHGYFDVPSDELRKALSEASPDLIFVGMGNPKQLDIIDQLSQHPSLQKELWMAVGGLFDFHGGSRPRAPEWMRKFRLEWLHIMWAEPHKFWRYAMGIPRFIIHTLKKLVRSEHAFN